MKKIVVLYHNDCRDGFGGAWAAWKKFGKAAEYIPALHQTPPDPKLRGKEIYSIDFTYFGRPLKELVRRNRHVTIIDHHVTAQPELAHVHESFFDLKHSGAVLAWKFFHPRKKVPVLLRYIEDNDLWKFSLPHAKEISAALGMEPYSFVRWEKLANDFERTASRKKYIERGALILALEDKIVRELASKAEPAQFQGYRAGVINSPVLQSQLGHELYEHGNFDIGIVWSRQRRMIRVSLRSSQSGKVNVAKLAKKYGGGGHISAAGFKFPPNKPLPWKYLKK